MSLSDKIDLFFHDYSLVPLFAFENYIGAIPFSSRSLLLLLLLNHTQSTMKKRLKIQKYKKKCIKHTHTDKSIQLPT